MIRKAHDSQIQERPEFIESKVMEKRFFKDLPELALRASTPKSSDRLPQTTTASELDFERTITRPKELVKEAALKEREETPKIYKPKPSGQKNEVAIPKGASYMIVYRIGPGIRQVEVKYDASLSSQFLSASS